jgi:hypothetical protein
MATGTGDGSVKSAQDLAVRLAADPDLLEEMKKNPAEAVARVAAPEQIPNTPIYRMVVGALGLIAVLAIIGVLVLAALGKQQSEAAVALGSTAVGALAGLLAPSPKQS